MNAKEWAAWATLLQPVVEQLGRIATALEALVPVPEDEPARTVSPPCPHPLELRIDFGITAGQPDWQCGACGHRSVPTA